jgi:hypothetical protein
MQKKPLQLLLISFCIWHGQLLTTASAERNSDNHLKEPVIKTLKGKRGGGTGKFRRIFEWWYQLRRRYLL